MVGPNKPTAPIAGKIDLSKSIERFALPYKATAGVQKK
jgi:hypothetical protein